MGTPTNHEIEVNYDGTGQGPLIPALAVGDTVHYSSNQGTVTMVFMVNGSPFLDVNNYEMIVVTSAAPPLAVQKDGQFTARCFITLPTGITVGWGPNYPNYGGDHVVKP